MYETYTKGKGLSKKGDKDLHRSQWEESQRTKNENVYLTYYENVLCVVKVRDLEYNEIETYMIVSSEGEPQKNIISDKSPLGKALISAKIGSIVQASVPAGVSEYEILDIL